MEAINFQVDPIQLPHQRLLALGIEGSGENILFRHPKVSLDYLSFSLLLLTITGVQKAYQLTLMAGSEVSQQARDRYHRTFTQWTDQRLVQRS